MTHDPRRHLTVDVFVQELPILNRPTESQPLWNPGLIVKGSLASDPATKFTYIFNRGDRVDREHAEKIVRDHATDPKILHDIQDLLEKHFLCLGYKIEYYKPE